MDFEKRTNERILTSYKLPPLRMLFSTFILLAALVQSMPLFLGPKEKTNELYCKNLHLPAVKAGFQKLNPFKAKKEDFTEVKKRVGRLLAASPPLERNTPMLDGFNPHSPELYYRFLTYASLAYADDEDIQKFAAKEPDFYTGDFVLMSRNERKGAKHFEDNDAVYIITRNDAQKLLALTWRGSAVKSDFMCDIKMAERKRGLALPFTQNCPRTTEIKQQDGFKHFYMSGGFADSMPVTLMEEVRREMLAAHNEYPKYQVVLNGHSLGGL